MSEAFKKNRNCFGGERLDSISPLNRNNLIEHLAKYGLVEGTGRTVLDVGCGTGYGSKYLAKKHRQVYGIDISPEAIQYAKKHWFSIRVNFSVGSGTQIPFDDDTFDITVAYEVFEHVCDWPKFLSEIRRVTKPTGKVYLSTPNKDVYYPKLPPNPFHCFEMRASEFRAVLEPFLNIERFLGMMTPVYNDHWIWRIVNPLFSVLHISHQTRNALNLRIINWIKPDLCPSDVVFSEREEDIRKSRFVVAICTPKKES